MTDLSSTYRQNERAARTAIRSGSYLTRGVRGPSLIAITQRTEIHEQYVYQYSG